MKKKKVKTAKCDLSKGIIIGALGVLAAQYIYRVLDGGHGKLHGVVTNPIEGKKVN